MVSTRLYPARVVVVADDTIVASHERLGERSQTRYDWQHYIPLVQRKPGALRNGAPFADMPEALLQLRRGLLRHSGGDRVMAQVLALVPTAGLEAVLVAAELALESRPRSGRVSLEHVAWLSQGSACGASHGGAGFHLHRLSHEIGRAAVFCGHREHGVFCDALGEGLGGNNCG